MRRAVVGQTPQSDQTSALETVKLFANAVICSNLLRCDRFDAALDESSSSSGRRGIALGQLYSFMDR
jgi:hypothetical protein